MKNLLSIQLKGDRIIWSVLGLLGMFSLLIVYSSTGSLAFKDYSGNTEYFLIKQTLLLGAGLLVTYLFYWMHYMKFSKWAPIMMAMAVPLLVFTLGFGASINDAYRWIKIPVVGLTFQTSDFAKIALIMYIARVISSKQGVIKDFKQAFLPIIMPIIIICLLIAPADLSSALLLFITSGLMMFVGRVNWKYLGLLFMFGLVAFSFLILLGTLFQDSFGDVIRVDTWAARISEFFGSSDGGWQVKHAKTAIAKGGLFGLGPGNSDMRYFLPSSYSDFIYAIICEEYGFFGAVCILALYLIFFFRVVRMVTINPRSFGAILAIGLAFMILIQAFLNMAVSVNLVPVTGLTLPIISKGGSSLLISCMAFGMILSVSRYSSASKTKETA